MEIIAAMELAERLLRQYGLSCWTVIISNSNTTLGRCYFPPRCQIELSRNHILKDTDKMITDTILHEIAHAIAGRTKGDIHGEKWKSAARKIGARPERCSAPGESNVRVKHRYIIKCANCKYKYSQYRTPEAITIGRKCPKCKTPIYWERIV